MTNDTMCSSMATGAGEAECHANKSRKQVRFEEDKLEERFELEISDQERIAKWMSRADFLSIRRDICNAIKENFFSQQYQQDDEERCFRGLEAIVSSCRQVEIQSFIQDLLEIQHDYKTLGLMGSAGLRNYSENNSRDATERARIIAKQDAHEARRVYTEWPTSTDSTVSTGSSDQWAALFHPRRVSVNQ
jgi:hypothetical protein